MVMVSHLVVQLAPGLRQRRSSWPPGSSPSHVRTCLRVEVKLVEDPSPKRRQDVVPPKLHQVLPTVVALDLENGVVGAQVAELLVVTAVVQRRLRQHLCDLPQEALGRQQAWMAPLPSIEITSKARLAPRRRLFALTAFRSGRWSLIGP